MTESQVTSKVVKALNEYGFFWKASDKFRAGIPDVIGVYLGRFIAIEMKIDSNTPTPLQTHTLHVIASNKGSAFTVTYVNKAKLFYFTKRSSIGCTLNELVHHILGIENSTI